MENQQIVQTEEEQALIEREYNALVDDYLHSNHRKKIDIIEKAFRFAEQAHRGVKRRSGAPYIMHPLAVARIITREIGMGSTSICASLLHDVVEDTDYTIEDIENLFKTKEDTENFLGKKIASIVDGLTKISGGVFGEKASAQTENFRKLLLTMSEDIRVILIKIADRLHNMRTLGSMPQHKQFKIAGETQYIYAPLANRLGLYTIKTELEDLSFKYEHPDKYKDISDKLEKTRQAREQFFEQFSKPIDKKLKSLGFKFEIHDRVKSIYSIWNKMQTKNISFEEVFDILAMRIVFEEEEKKDERSCCWEIYSAVTNVYTPHPERTRDWINTPKANGYEALHVTVMGQGGQWIEVQIRSRRMDAIAERGFAAHWRYKTNENLDAELEVWLQNIREILENPEPDAIDLLDTIKLNLYASEIFVFTPKGEIRTLPQGATSLDFAFSLHTDIGLHCIGAKVNHKLVPLSYVLSSGDQVEILTSRKQNANPDWINFVKTARAKTKIKSLFKKEYKSLAKEGESLLQAGLERINMKLSNENIAKMLDFFHEAKKEDLCYKIGKGIYKVNDLEKTVFKEKGWTRYLKRPFGNKAPGNILIEDIHPPLNQPRKINTKATLIISDNNPDVNYCDCCNPIPGDEILAFVEDDGKTTLHRRQCPVAMRLKSSFGERIISAAWNTQKGNSYLATIEIKGIDRVGILSEIIKIITDVHAVNVSKVNLETKDGIFGGMISLSVHGVEDIENLNANIRKINGINSANRVGQMK